MSGADRRAQRSAARRILWCGDAPGGNYTTKALELARRLTSGPPGVHHVGIFHDEDCPALRPTPGICRCDADVEEISQEQAIETETTKRGAA